MGTAAYNAGGEGPAIILKGRKKFPDAKPAVWFVVDNVMKSHAALSAKGVKFISELFRIKTEWASGFEDPPGNRLGIIGYDK